MAEQWEANLRAAIRGACGAGWTARRGGPETTQLIYRPPHPLIHGKLPTPKQPQQTGRIYLPWEPRRSPQILEAVIACNRMVQRGTHLAEAATIACGATPIGPALDWEALIDRYRHHRVQVTGQISERTWHRMHVPALRKWVELVTGQAPPNTAQVALQAYPWGAPGSSGRKHAVHTLTRFLGWAVNLGVLGPEWEPPADQKELYGSSPKPSTRITGVISDSEIEELLGSLHHQHWWWILAAMALYGLRPEEVIHLEMRGDELWCTYQKRSSGGITKPRRLYALEPFAGLEARWLQRWHQRDRLPDLGRRVGRVGTSVNIYLRRQAVWTQLQEADPSRKLVPYSFRHAYALRGAGHGIPPRFMAAAMGHTLATHLKSYSKWMDADSMESAFSKVRQSHS